MCKRFSSALVFLWCIVQMIDVSRQTFPSRSCLSKENRFMVHLAMAPDSYICGASLINHIWSLTAARCVEERTYGINFVVVLDLNSFPNHTKINVLEIYAHPEYNEKDWTNDIALLKLDDTLSPPFPSFVRLPSSSMKNVPCTTGLLMGWGIGTFEEYAMSGLHCTNLPLINLQECETISKYHGLILRDGMHICSLGVGTDECKNEAGDPLLCDGIQVGIVSWGTGCIPPEDLYNIVMDYEAEGNPTVLIRINASDVESMPGVYTRVESYLAFIEETIGKKSLRHGKSGDGHSFDVTKGLFVAMFVLLYI